MTVTDVDGRDLSVVVETVRARPLKRANNNNTIWNLRLGRVDVLILGVVTHQTNRPCALAHCLSYLNFAIFCNWFQKGFIWIDWNNFFHFCLVVPFSFESLRSSWLNVNRLAVVENALFSMHPHGWVFHLRSVRNQILSLFRFNSLNFACLAVFCWFEQTFWKKSCWLSDTSDLSTQIMLFLSFEERVCEYLPFQISRKEDFNTTSSFNLTRGYIRKFSPAWKRVFWYKVCVLVNSCCTFSIEARFLFLTVSSFVIATFYCCFHHVVITLSTCNFSKESSRGRIHFSCKLLKRLLKTISFLLSKTDASPWKNSLLSIEVLNEANWCDFRNLSTFFFRLGTSKSNLHYLRVLLNIGSKLSVVMIIIDF